MTADDDSAAELERLLHSGQADDVAAALDSLDLACVTDEAVPVPMPSADLLAPLGPELPDDVASHYVRVLDRYEAWEPPVSRVDVERELALAAARYAPSSLALEVSLVLKQAQDPARSVRRALEAIAERGVAPGEVEHAAAFVSYLLAGEDAVRAATVDALSDWRSGGLGQVVDAVRAELDDKELARLT